MVEQEDSELTSSHGNNKITTIYRAAIYDDYMKTSRKDFTQLKIKKEPQ